MGNDTTLTSATVHTRLQIWCRRRQEQQQHTEAIISGEQTRTSCGHHEDNSKTKVKVCMYSRPSTHTSFVSHPILQSPLINKLTGYAFKPIYTWWHLLYCYFFLIWMKRSSRHSKVKDYNHESTRQRANVVINIPGLHIEFQPPPPQDRRRKGKMYEIQTVGTKVQGRVNWRKRKSAVGDGRKEWYASGEKEVSECHRNCVCVLVCVFVGGISGHRYTV